MNDQPQEETTADFDPTLEPWERDLIAEEENILLKVQAGLKKYVPKSARTSNFDDQMLELRDLVIESGEEELPQIVAQMDRVASLSQHFQKGDASLPPNPGSPYFGHIRVQQNDRVMDVLLGQRALIDREVGTPIIDWRHAPISKLYYGYQEGDEYEEELGGQLVEGTVLAHRRVMIMGGQLVRIEALQGTYQLSHNRWCKKELNRPTLKGGQGTAVRPTTLLGTGAENLQAGGDKRLQAITGLIDPEQFKIITRPESGVVVVDGGAGSGKTTIALHRLAYLAFNNPQAFAPERTMVVVFNQALARYIAHLLPALDVGASRIEVFEDLMTNLRNRHFSTIKGAYTETTPFPVVRFKLHPVSLALLKSYAALRTNEFRAELVKALERTKGEEQGLKAWDSIEHIPFAPRLVLFGRWVAEKEILSEIGKSTLDWVEKSRITELLDDLVPAGKGAPELVMNMYEEAFSRIDFLTEITQKICPDEFTPADIEQVRDWGLKQMSQREEHEIWKTEGKNSPTEPGEEAHTIEPPQLDREDDALLLLFHQIVIGPIRNKRKKPLKFLHLVIDEAQDFSPLDLQLLTSLAADPLSITLAGDTDQRMGLYNSFTTWEEMLRYLNLKGTEITPLRVGYRATKEIMAFAREVLGPLANERDWEATRSGEPVTLLRFTDPGQAVALLSDSLRGLLRREPSANIALIARYPAQADAYHDGLKHTELKVKRVADQDFSFQPGIEITDISQVKGLEFDYVILLETDAQTYPNDPQSRYLLHIGATRAAHQLWLITTRAPSPLIPEHMEPQFL